MDSTITAWDDVIRGHLFTSAVLDRFNGQHGIGLDQMSRHRQATFPCLWFALLACSAAMDDTIYRNDPFFSVAGNDDFQGTFENAADFLEFRINDNSVKLRIIGMTPGEIGIIRPDNPDDETDETDEAFIQRIFEHHFGLSAFNRFVTALGRREEYCYLQSLDLSGVIWTSMPGPGLERSTCERLFSQVLPQHPTLEAIRFLSNIPVEYLRMFTSAIPVTADRTRLRDLLISPEDHSIPLNEESTQALATMIRRNVPISRIMLQCILSPNGYALICQAVAASIKLRDLLITVRSANSDTLQGLAASQSLRTLSVRHSDVMSPLVLEQIARDLRSNTTLQALRLVLHESQRELPALFWQPLLETLEFHNWALRDVRTAIQDNPTFAPLLQRNSLIRPVINDLQARNFRVARAELPFYLERIQPFTSLVFRILRRVDWLHR